MADGTVGVRQASSPDRLIDNETLVIGGDTVYRQRVQDPEVIALLEDVKAAVEGTISAAVSGTVALDGPTLAALETINAVVSGTIAVSGGTIALDAATLAALEAITVSGTVALDAPTLAALESITATISGSVEVSNDTGSPLAVTDQDLIDLGFPLGDIDPLNSKSTQLAANEDFIGTWQEFAPHPGILTFIVYNSPFVTVQIQWSADGITQDTSVLGTTPVPIQAPATPGGLTAATYVSNVPINRYYRLRILNGPTPSTIGQARMWRLRAPYGGNFATLATNPTAFSVALLTKAVTAGTTFSGTFGLATLAEHSHDADNSYSTPLTNGAITTFTVDTATDELLSVAHGLAVGDAVVLTTTGTLPAPLDNLTGTGLTLLDPILEVTYWVQSVTADRFKLTSNINAAVPVAINITDAGTGVHSYQKRGQFIGSFEDYSQVGHGLDFYFGVERPAVLRTEWSSTGTTVGAAVGALFDVSNRPLTFVQASALGPLYVNVAVVQTMIAKYRRVRIVNGPTNQVAGLFALTTFIGRDPYGGSFGGLEANLTNLSTALLTRAVVAGVTPSGLFRNVTLSEDGYLHVASGQTIDDGNTRSIVAADAQPGNPWVGEWTLTRDSDVVRILTVLAATDPAIGGTFTFQFSEDAVTPIIDEVRLIGDFTDVRDFDLLNAGAYYRTKFEPAAPLGVETVFLTTTLRRQDDGHFARLAEHELEEANAALGSQFAYLKAFDSVTGKSVNLRPTVDGDLRVGYEAADDATNTVSITLSAYLGTPYVPNVGGAPGVLAADTWAGGWRDVKNFAGATISASFASLGQGYYEFSNDGGATISHFYTTAFGGGAGDFQVPKAAKFSRILFQNRTNASGLFKATHLLNYAQVQPFMFPAGAPIDPSFPAALVKALLTGESPTAGYVNAAMDDEGRLAITQGSDFSRLLARVVENTDELRLDVEPASAAFYIGKAADATGTAAAAWDVIQISLSATRNPNRIRFRQAVAWDSRTVGW